MIEADNVRAAALIVCKNIVSGLFLIWLFGRGSTILITAFLICVIIQVFVFVGLMLFGLPEGTSMTRNALVVQSWFLLVEGLAGCVFGRNTFIFIVIASAGVYWGWKQNRSIE